MNHRSNIARGLASAVALSWALPGAALAQTAPAAGPAAPASTEEEIVVLSPFEVTASESTGYVATTTMAGSRINTELRDVGSAISVVTAEFLRDTGATNNQTLLQYTTNTEVGSIGGNFVNARAGATQDEASTFTNPNTNTRVRGLAAADNTRNFFLTSIPWDAYNVDRVDMQRGPNSILFGMGSPAGIIDTTTKTAQFRNFGEVELRYGSHGSNRVMLDYNRALLADELALRVAAVRDDTQFKQDPARSVAKRLFATTRWEPKFLKKGPHRTVVKASFEAGEVRSNSPRTITPIDYITPWFTAMNKGTYDPTTVQDNNGFTDADGNTYYPGDRGEAIRTLQNGQANPVYEPWLGNFAQSFGGPLAFFPDAGQPGQSGIVLSEFANIYGLTSTGAVQGSGTGIGGLNYSRRVSIDQYLQYAIDVGLPYNNFGVYKNRTLSDPSIFDFYNQLLDGPNKREWQDFKNFTASVSQTFFDQRFGFDAAYDWQSYDSGAESFLGGQRAGIFIDVNENDLDGSPNPNLGRPFVSDSVQYGNNAATTTRESARFTVFAMHDFNRVRSGQWWRKLLGRHVVTGLYSRDASETDNRNFLRYGTDTDYARWVSTTPTAQKFTDNLRQVNPVVYLGPSLLSASSAAGAHIPNPTAQQIPTTGTIRMFDSHWNATVDPAAPWTNPYNNTASTQSENPANYVGWTAVPFNIISAADGNRDALTYQAQKTRTRVGSKAAVLQSFLWDGALVGMWGVRNDHVKNWSLNAPLTTDGHAILDRDVYRLAAEPGSEEDNTTTWSVVAHLHKFLGARAPFQVSLFYSESENFQPGAGRVDLYGNGLSSPSGRTNDRGIVISTKDERFSLKVNKYETKIQNASATLDGTWFLGGVEEWGAEWANIFEHNLTGMTMGTAEPGGTGGRYTYAPATGETQAQASAREAAAVAAWRAHQARIPNAYWDSWHLSRTAVEDMQQQGPAGFAVTQDYVSKGWEFELTANPLPNWRVSLNAAKTTAVRNNIGGAALAEFVEIVNNDLVNTAAGDLRIWWGGAGNPTILQLWRQTFYTNYASLRLAEGTATPELRKWRFNLVTNYDFKSGFLKGVNVGLGYRWQDKIAIGYPVIPTADPNTAVYDFEHPYYGPSEDAVDFWIGYGRKLTDKIDWHIQLNVRDAFKGNKLIPLTTQPDGSIAAWRIAPAQTWTLTNTFKF